MTQSASDIVEWSRGAHPIGRPDDNYINRCPEAADEIGRLRAALKKIAMTDIVERLRRKDIWQRDRRE